MPSPSTQHPAPSTQGPAPTGDLALSCVCTHPRTPARLVAGLQGFFWLQGRLRTQAAACVGDCGTRLLSCCEVSRIRKSKLVSAAAGRWTRGQAAVPGPVRWRGRRDLRRQRCMQHV
ncbi:hypothetical protein L226DRAFT_214987 [Lentinus tigrinus ALCF2SS1-7]|uniref:uncharacterized protein n=1 Tax=Lentinus tigrinus ALCF2SS1-7 TaxID=1328758 RepID=UPI001165FF89|nr:hypothetical protein L226DRAFT_214987 [Lentinus tigrinus ALCF2SS1-7]